MQTNFTLAQLADPNINEADKILRACVHCGFCTATCPTYVLLGDELDSPRGRIYLIKQMLEGGRPATAKVVKHIDRCLSCLSCMTTCPSGVHYMHLVDHARAHIENTFRRPLGDRFLRGMLARVLPRPGYLRFALMGAWLVKPLRRALPVGLGAMLALVPRRLPSPSQVDRPQVFEAEGRRRMRVALLSGCAQQTLRPSINEATIRLLTRHGCEVVVVRGVGCCGALVHHMGRDREALDAVKSNIDAWRRELERGGLDAIAINASGCGTMVKDYGYMLRNDPVWADAARQVSSLAKDICEIMAELGLAAPSRKTGMAVAYHSACSLQHGQRIGKAPRDLLSAAGFEVREIPDGHLCCGSAGTYNLLQPALAGRLLARKVQSIESVKPDIVAAGNIGCLVQIGNGMHIPVVHPVELLDWATGGPTPRALRPISHRIAAGA
jgi:glycolate oxidase iron-sulfur subunit